MRIVSCRPSCSLRLADVLEARVQKDVSLTIKLDPRVLRHSVVKLGERLDQLQIHKTA